MKITGKIFWIGLVICAASFLFLIATCVAYLLIYGNVKAPEWISLWGNCNVLLLTFMILFGIVANIKTVLAELKSLLS